MLCALALALVAFAHRPIEADPRVPDPQIAEYIALGGSLADLCRTGEDGENGAGQTDCPACTLAKSMAVAEIASGPSGTVTRSAEPTLWPRVTLLAGHAPRAPPARGPPLVRMI